jgi:NAD+-dependent secondary alcohol dehydrogenase Adh1
MIRCIPTGDIVSNEINFVGNLVGTYNDLVELMALTSEGKVALHTVSYPLEAVNDATHDLEAGRLRGRGIMIP